MSAADALADRLHEWADTRVIEGHGDDNAKLQRTAWLYEAATALRSRPEPPPHDVLADADAIAETMETKGDAYRVGLGNGYAAALRRPTPHDALATRLSGAIEVAGGGGAVLVSTALLSAAITALRSLPAAPDEPICVSLVDGTWRGNTSSGPAPDEPKRCVHGETRTRMHIIAGARTKPFYLPRPCTG